MKFSFMGRTYEVPEDIDIIVFAHDWDDAHGPVIDFDMVKDGEVIAVFGGTDMEGNTLPTWEDVGIRRITGEGELKLKEWRQDE